MNIESALRTACLLEVTARKPGNVHPGAAFADCDWHAFAASAEAIAPVLSHAAKQSLGKSILQAVEATCERVGRNTNLGMILLLAPLAAVPAGEDLHSGVGRLLAATTIDDAGKVYEAIRRANPGGLGSAESEDVSSSPTVNLVDAMMLAADRDDVAKQYANNFEDVFELSKRFDASELPELEQQIVRIHVERLAARSDTLILRKCGPAVAEETSWRAKEVIAAGLFNTEDGLKRFADLDAWLRADGNRRNPGTTADLIAAALFVAIREGRLPLFDAGQVVAYACQFFRI